MQIFNKNIEIYLDLGRTCYKRTYQLNDSVMVLDYCLEKNKDFIWTLFYFKMEHLEQQIKELIDVAKNVAKELGFQEVQLYLPQNISADEVSFYKENGFEFYPNSPIKMYYKLTNKNK